MLKSILTLIAFLALSIVKAQVPLIKVDQFGYHPLKDKFAILSNPIIGYNSSNSYVPSANIDLIDVSLNTSVFSGPSVIWNNGNTHNASGDQIWWFDFSSWQTAGTYYIHDVTNNISSDTFKISNEVYNEVFKDAFKSFYYQRCGHAKVTPYCNLGYADAACHIGTLQDLNCQSIITQDPASEKNLSGGWHDAGDYNKYVNFLWSTMTDLLLSYEYNPQAWSDDMDIPESGNYIPDLLDEIKIETDWLLKMQENSGGVLSLVGVPSGANSPPSVDNLQRYYGPATTSASFTAASIFALAAIQFQQINCNTAQSYAIILESAAISAYNWAVNNPNITYYNTGNLAAGEQEVDSYNTAMRQLTAAIYLYDLTNTSTYKTYVENNYNTAHMIQWGFVYPFESTIQLSLLYYADLSTASSGVSSAINNAFKNSVDNTADNYPAHINGSDAYRAFISDGNHVWGSNNFKMNMANAYLSYKHYNLDPSKNAVLQNIVASYVHYIHGCNPIALVYLTNQTQNGAERSINTIYHSWFEDGSPLWDEVGVSTYGPAPGFLSGGPNPNWSLADCCPSGCGSTQNNALCTTLSPPINQPILKSYLDWNTSWPQNSWEITENSIYTQASYLLGLSSLVDLVNINVATNELSEISNGDLAIDQISKGLVLKSKNSFSFLISIDNSGNLVTSALTSPSEKVQLTNHHLYIKTKNKGFILKSPDGNYWHLSVSPDGKLVSNALVGLPTNHVSQESGNFEFINEEYGLILKNDNDECFRIKLNDAGTVICLKTNCP